MSHPWQADEGRPPASSSHSIFVQDSAGLGIEIIHRPVQHLRDLERLQPRHGIVGLLVEDESAWPSLEIQLLEQRGRGNEPSDVAARAIEARYLLVENDRQEIHGGDL